MIRLYPTTARSLDRAAQLALARRAAAHDPRVSSALAAGLADPNQTERVFLGRLIGYLAVAGFRCYHTHRSDHSAAGFPDLVAVRPPQLLLVELKRVGRRATPAQRTWLEDLAAVTGPPTVAVWTPGDAAVIEQYVAAPAE